MLRTGFHASVFSSQRRVSPCSASFYSWTQADALNRLVYIDAERQWVRVAASSAPALESDETWQVTTACVRPYFVAAAEETRTKLAAYADTAPDDARLAQWSAAAATKR